MQQMVLYIEWRRMLHSSRHDGLLCEGKLNVKTNFEGYCATALTGNVKVGLNVGPCDGYTGGDAHTGWDSVSRITVEEVEPAKES